MMPGSKVHDKKETIGQISEPLPETKKLPDMATEKLALIHHRFRLTDHTGKILETKSDANPVKEVNTGEGLMTNQGLLKSRFASSCMYLALYDKKTGLMGLAHVEPSDDIKHMLNAWNTLARPQDTIAYMVKGNGLSIDESSGGFLKRMQKQMKDSEIGRVIEDFEKPVEGETCERGKTASNITLKQDGSVEVFRYHQFQKGRGTLYRISPEGFQLIEAGIQGIRL
jgi:hypothetical protein